MGSSRPIDRSLGEATFLPQWMKGKLDTRFDYTDNAFSPPADDTFFYIRYPRYPEPSINENATSNDKEGFRPLNELLGNRSETNVPSASKQLISSQSNKNPGSDYKDTKGLDFSKHPLPCQSFIPFASDKVTKPKIIVANKSKAKHQPSDDEFRNDKTAECGRSIVHVANQIMSSKFGKSNSSDSTANNVRADESTAQNQRKVSKSLPATPLASPSGTPDSSPKSRRRVYANRFFTGAFVPDGDRYKNGWLLSSILGQSRELITPKIEEEDEQLEPPERPLSRKKSISSQNLIYFGKDDKPTVNILQAKPSELREMNFWSPTSM